MPITSLLETQTSANFTVEGLLEVLMIAIGCGLVMSLVYLFTYRKENYSKGLSITIILLPAIVSMIIMMVSSMATALGVAGAFSRRWRHFPRSRKSLIRRCRAAHAP